MFHSAKLFRLLMLMALPVILFTSCSSYKNVPYFNDIPDSLNSPVVKAHHTFTEPRIQADDQLSISVTTIDFPVQAAAPTAVGTGTGTIPASTGSATGALPLAAPTYLVDKNGGIDLPIVGRLNVLNLTTTELKEVIYEKAKKYYVSPIVNVRFANFYVTVLGEVNRPGTYSITNEKVTLLDAIGLAGDMLITGQRENILLVREENGSKTFVRLNLNTSEVLRSPYFYLRSGDAIYVEPIKAKVNNTTTDVTQDKYLPYIFSGLSLLFSVANILIQLDARNNR